MDKFQKFDENIDIFPDVSIEPIEELMEAENEEDFEEPAPMVVRKQEEIFPSLSNKKEEKAPVIVQDEPTVIEGDVPDKMEVVVPKRKGRGKAKKPYNAKPRTAKQLAVLEKARLARKAKREKQEKEKQNIKLDIKPTPTPPPTPEPKPEVKPQPKPQPKTEVKPEQKKMFPIPKSINDFDTFCDYMDKYNQQRNMRNQQKNIHPNKMVNKNLLPRPPLIPNQKNPVHKIKKTVPVMAKPKNIYDPNYALNMLTNRRNTNRFKDPFSR